MKKFIIILLTLSFILSQEPCEGTCLSAEESENMVNNIQKLQFDLDKFNTQNKNLKSK